jgi:hypothetical protein
MEERERGSLGILINFMYVGKIETVIEGEVKCQ